MNENTNNKPLFSDVKNYIIGGLLLLTVGLIVFNNPPSSDNSDELAFDSQIRTLHIRDSIKTATINALIQASKIKDERTKLIVFAQESEIKALKAKAAKQVASIPQDIRKAYPQIDSALAAKDAVIAAVEAKADTLQNALDFQVKLVKELQIVVVDQQKIKDQMFTACEQRIIDLQTTVEKQEKRSKRTAKVLKIAAIVGLVGGFFVGNQ